MVPPPLKPYIENTSKYHPITVASCSGYIDNDQTDFEDDVAQPSIKTVISSGDTPLTHKSEISEEFKIILKNHKCRGATPPVVLGNNNIHPSVNW